MKDIYAIGAKDSVLIFQSLGIDSFVVKDEAKLKAKIEKLSQNAKIIFISESLSPFLSDVVNKYKQDIYPILLFVPLEGIKSNRGIEKLRKDVEKAIGMALI